MGKLEDWWEEDANRVNAMSKHAQTKGVVVNTGSVVPPKLNKDGSLLLKGLNKLKAILVKRQ